MFSGVRQIAKLAAALMNFRCRLLTVRTITSALGSERDAGIKHVVRHGNVYEEILEMAKMLEASLIIMGAHKPNYGDYLLGPNATRVVRHSACSVLVLRDT